jgi:hypothetical protein
MQLKTIEKNIKSKMEEWLNTITDESLRSSVKDHLLVSGGSITSMLLNEPVNDYDVYLMNIDVCKKLAQYYTKDHGITILDGRDKAKLVSDYNKSFEHLNESDGTEAINYNNSYAISLRNLKEDQIKLYFDSSKGGMRVNESVEVDKLNYTPLYFSPNAISLSHNLQIVLRFWGNAEQIHKTFDFIHATNYFTFDEGLVRNLAAVESVLTKQLKYQGSHYPVTSIIRAKKFIKRGFNINAGELLKIMFQISSLNLSDPDVLEEQLIGVDVAYFDLIITALRNKFESDKDFKLSAEYFNSLIDKIFNENDDIS